QNKEPEQGTDYASWYPEGYAFNLSDFALFLSVMKNKRAYECTLSIILGEPDIKMREVKVEQVVLNRYGKRAIRLDAWGRTEDERQVNMEMQNSAESDDIPKRSRYYQGMLDTPILKSGKETKYRELPSTIIIFITQEDLFGKDLAMYTFTEQCEEIAGLHLEDGNMSSKNGSKELVGMLQYMKHTTLDNPEIEVKDERLIELDRIVREVKGSEEWEAVKMNILEVGIERGKEIGKETGEKKKLLELVCKKIKKGLTVPEIADMLEEPEETIREICDIAHKYAPDYDVMKILKEYSLYKKGDA
ncbi:MAG: PD-(D/E)XK nuclease family transposase, partial [Lachnospiraceae bacterium]|nr:PD-(D/E)XK nuclease family transposase [Lachnospiraceae bacterium]